MRLAYANFEPGDLSQFDSTVSGFALAATQAAALNNTVFGLETTFNTIAKK